MGRGLRRIAPSSPSASVVGPARVAVRVATAVTQEVRCASESSARPPDSDPGLTGRLRRLAASDWAR